MMSLRSAKSKSTFEERSWPPSESPHSAVCLASDAKLNREQRLKMAMSAMNDGHGMVYTEAVQLFDVKRSTLHDHMSSKCLKFTKGRYPLLTAVEERALLEMLRRLHSKGYAITSYVCRRAAFMYAERCNYPLTRMGSQRMAGRKWFCGFVKRNNVTIGNVVVKKESVGGRRRSKSKESRS